jgi:hypothetical protein
MSKQAQPNNPQEIEIDGSHQQRDTLALAIYQITGDLPRNPGIPHQYDRAIAWWLQSIAGPPTGSRWTLPQLAHAWRDYVTASNTLRSHTP